MLFPFYQPSHKSGQALLCSWRTDFPSSEAEAGLHAAHVLLESWGHAQRAHHAAQHQSCKQNHIQALRESNHRSLQGMIVYLICTHSSTSARPRRVVHICFPSEMGDLLKENFRWRRERGIENEAKAKQGEAAVTQTSQPVKRQIFYRARAELLTCVSDTSQPSLGEYEGKGIKLYSGNRDILKGMRELVHLGLD